MPNPIRIFNSQTKTVTFAAGLLAVSAFFSRLLGLVRDRLLAGKFGAGEELDIYFAAFRIPDLIYAILIIGGISAVFLPLFSEKFRESQEKAWEFTSNLLNCFLVLLILFCGILFFLAPFLINNLVAPGIFWRAKRTGNYLNKDNVFKSYFLRAFQRLFRSASLF